MPELLQRVRIVVIPLLFLEERIVDGVRIEIDSDEKLRVRAGKRFDHASGGLQVSFLVAAVGLRIDIERQDTAQLGAFLRSRKVLEEIVRHHLIAVAPLAVVVVLLEMVGCIPLRDATGRVAPHAAVEREQHRHLVLARMANDRVQRVFGDPPRAAATLDVPVRIELPIRCRAPCGSHVQERHPHSDPNGRRLVARIDRVELVRPAERNARHAREKVERFGVAWRTGQVERAPFGVRGRQDDVLSRQELLGADDVDGDHFDCLPRIGGGREGRRNVAVELETRCARVRESRLDCRDIGTCRPVRCCIRLPGDANLHALYTRRIEGPSGDSHRRADDRIAGRGVHPSDGCRCSGVGCGQRRCRDGFGSGCQSPFLHRAITCEATGHRKPAQENDESDDTRAHARIAQSIHHGRISMQACPTKQSDA